jgi:hypothetical protein
LVTGAKMRRAEDPREGTVGHRLSPSTIARRASACDAQRALRVIEA